MPKRDAAIARWLQRDKALRRHLDDIKKYVSKFVPEFIPEFAPEFDLNTDFYLGTNSGMNFFMSSKLRLKRLIDMARQWSNPTRDYVPAPWV